MSQNNAHVLMLVSILVGLVGLVCFLQEWYIIQAVLMGVSFVGMVVSVIALQRS